MSVLATLSSDAVFKVIQMTLIGLDMIEAAGANAEVLRAARQNARDQGREFSPEDVEAAFARMGTARDDLDAVLAADDDELTDVVDPEAQSGQEGEGEPAPV